MKAVFLLDINTYTRNIFTYLSCILLLCLGIFTGTKFNLSVGEGIYLDGPYTIGYMVGLLSLAIIFIASITGSQLLFREWDNRFDLLLFTTPLKKKQFTIGRFTAFFSITTIGFICLIAGFAIGQSMRGGSSFQGIFNLSHYTYPLFVFGCINSLFVCSVLSLIAWISRNKLLVALSGLLLYMLYMIVLLFSSSPFMAQSTPQSTGTQLVSALIDPFGLSAYFFESRHFSVTQRNTMLTPLRDSLLYNRIAVSTISFLLVAIGIKYYSFSASGKKRRVLKKQVPIENTAIQIPDTYTVTRIRFGTLEQFKSIISFLKTDLIYLFKSKSLPLSTLLLLFYLGMEIYAEIEKGIRLPQQFASSGLIASSIIENFHLLGVLLIVFYVNDVFWRSKLSRFHLLETSSFLSGGKFAGQWLSITILICFFSMMAILLGVVFQWVYQYPRIDLTAYAGIYIFNTLPLVILTGFLVLMNRLIPNKYFALGISLIFSITTASPIATKLITSPVFLFLTGFKGNYSDFAGYDSYLPTYMFRFIVGFSLLMVIWLTTHFISSKKVSLLPLVMVVCIFITGIMAGFHFTKGYHKIKKEELLNDAENYEHLYRKYQVMEQPIVTNLKTAIHLFPSNNSYEIEGVYTLQNKSTKDISAVLIQFDDGFVLQKARLAIGKENIDLNNYVSEIKLKQPLAVDDTLNLHFSMQYKWYAVNEHQSFNAIIHDGSFMRISRYYPKIGYQSDREITDEIERAKRNLGTASAEKKLTDPKSSADDLIQLTIQVDTEKDQTVAGTGELIKQWQTGERNYFLFQSPTPIPFRFALSSARYAINRTIIEGIPVSILYHPLHHKTVAHLMNNIRETMKYCRTNYGPYPFRSVTFAEVSSFTRGFAATAYPSTIFMTERTIFHTNIKADLQQDVINELAGHELAHLWWGNSLVRPDDREGSTMLTESMAMYTEMMLYKKMYGKEKMMERVKMHQQIYDAEKGFSPDQPLYKVTGGNTHIAYSKGAVLMVQLSELIGEATLNKALGKFLNLQKNTTQKPVSTDLINEIISVSDKKFHAQIRKLFMDI